MGYRDNINQVKPAVSAGLLSLSLLLVGCDSSDELQGEAGLGAQTPASAAETSSQGGGGDTSAKENSSSTSPGHPDLAENAAPDQPDIDVAQNPSAKTADNASHPVPYSDTAPEDPAAAPEAAGAVSRPRSSPPDIDDYSPRLETYRLALEDYRSEWEVYRRHLEQQRMTEEIDMEEYQRSIAGYFDASTAYQKGMNRYRKAAAKPAP